MAKETKKESNTAKNLYKAANPVQFSEWYTATAPCYDELSKGESVELNVKDPIVKDWIENKIIVKE